MPHGACPRRHASQTSRCLLFYKPLNLFCLQLEGQSRGRSLPGSQHPLFHCICSHLLWGLQRLSQLVYLCGLKVQQSSSRAFSVHSLPMAHVYRKQQLPQLYAGSEASLPT
jgi:hypothetical protein